MTACAARLGLPLVSIFEDPGVSGSLAIEDRPVAVDGRVEVRPILPVTATIDHRFVDGWHIARAMKIFRAYLHSPADYEPSF